jgi:two-component system, LytTR family, response regulator
MKRLRTLIVDDERLARQQLADLLAGHPGILPAGEASDLSEAVALLAAVPPDVIFLDVSMPPESGFELLPHVPVGSQVVFVTAHADHAVRAFEAAALDYLLKPVTPERLAITLKRLGETEALPAEERLLLLGDGRQWKKIPPAGIAAVFAEGNYSCCHSIEGERFVLRRPFKEWLAELEGGSFVRLNRSMVVNPAAILHLEKQRRGGGRLRLQGVEGTIPLGREAMRLLAARALS